MGLVLREAATSIMSFGATLLEVQLWRVEGWEEKRRRARPAKAETSSPCVPNADLSPVATAGSAGQQRRLPERSPEHWGSGQGTGPCSPGCRAGDSASWSSSWRKCPVPDPGGVAVPVRTRFAGVHLIPATNPTPAGSWGPRGSGTFRIRGVTQVRGDGTEVILSHTDLSTEIPGRPQGGIQQQ